MRRLAQTARQLERGSTLLLSLWILVLLSAVILAWARYVDQEVMISSEMNLNLIARTMAHSGVAIALHPLATRRTPLLVNDFGDRGYHAEITGEGGRLNLNWLLAGEDPQKTSLLRQYFRARGLNLEEAQSLLDSMLDWVGPAGLNHLNGAPDTPDYHPPHRPFVTIDEVRLVHNSGPLVSRSGWEEDFTLYSLGPVDLAAAPLRILLILPGIGDERAQRFLQVRNGPDGLEGTADDHEFKDMAEIRSYLGLGDAAFTQLGGLVGINDPTVRIRSTGWVGKVNRQVEVVARKVGATPINFLWKEP